MSDEYKRILVCNVAHIGDVILTTSVLPALKSAYPQAEIGVLVGSWSLPVVENHALIDWVHTFDHPVHDRSKRSRKAKKRRGSKTYRKALQEIQEKKYDLAFDMYSLYPTNVGKFLKNAEIPHRVGFWFSPSNYYFNHPIFWFDLLSENESAHLVDIHGWLLRGFGIEEEHLALLKPTLEYKAQIHPLSLPEEYVVVHMGVGEPKREWNVASWKELVEKLEKLGLPLVFLGRGNREKALIESASATLKNSINLCDQLSWKQLIPVIRGAKMFVGLESMAGHMAAVTNTPSVVIYGGTALIHRWRPFSAYAQVVEPPQKFFADRVAPPEAIHQITADDIFQKVKLALSR